MLKMSLGAVFAALVFVSSLAQAELTPSRYVTVDGLRVAVYESDGHKGPGIVMIHGNTSSANSYERVFSTPFAHEYKIAALDLPGYGKSENSPSGYSIALWTKTVATVARAVGADDGVIVGWSLGGDIAFQTIRLLPNAKGFFVFGTTPVGSAPELPSAFLPPDESYAGEAVTYGTKADLAPEQVKSYVRAFFRPHCPNVPATMIRDGLRCDPQTRATVLRAALGQDPDFHDEVQIVRNMQKPLAMMVGKKDAFLRIAFLEQIAPSLPTLWRHKIVEIPETGHAVHYERPLVWTAYLREFVKDVTR